MNNNIEENNKYHAGKLLDDALEILSNRDEESTAQINKAILMLFQLRDSYFLGFPKRKRNVEKKDTKP